MAATIGLVLDCTDPAGLARFWSEALGYTTLGGAGNYVMLVDSDGIQPKLLLQAVPEAKPGKNRMHFDIEACDVDGEASRLEALGARPRPERDSTGSRQRTSNTNASPVR
ncbi:MAG: VOC family protein [Ilumatobacteraceae bacterium]